MREEVFRAQPGPQARFLASSASLTFFGGGAFGGKTIGILLDPLRDIAWAGFRGIIFRRTTPELTAAGGLWDTSFPLYSRHGGIPRDIPHLDWRFPSGAHLKFSHLQRTEDMFAHQGAQYSFIGFDEVTHFEEKPFFYLFGRLRIAHDLNGFVIHPRVRACCNPDPNSWVAKFISWWIDQETGFAIPERAGVVRWFARDGDVTYWGSTVREVRDQAPHLFVDEHGNRLPYSLVCHSCTFIPSLYSDNAIGMRRDPGYVARLRAQSAVDRARLLGGNWKIKETAGEVFREEWFPVVLETPTASPVVARLRYWDLAGSKRRRSNHTAGLRLALHADGTYTVEDVQNEKLRPKGTEDLIGRVAKNDGVPIGVHIEQDVGGGELLVDQYQRHALRGFTVTGHVVRGQGTKLERAKPASSAAEKGHIRLVKAAWNAPFLHQLQAFPDSNEDDMVDALSGAFAAIQNSGDIPFGVARTR